MHTILIALEIEHLGGAWCYPTPSEGWGHGGSPQRPIRATPQGLDQRSKMKDDVPERPRCLHRRLIV